MSAPSVWHEERFFCILAWVFMLRAGSEASDLMYCRNGDTLSNLHNPLPPDTKGVIGMVGSSLVIRLRSRKNSPQGDSISRTCACQVKERTSVYLSESVCPVHVLNIWLSHNIACGDRIFK